MNQNEKPPVSNGQNEKSNGDSWDFSELIDGIVLREEESDHEKKARQEQVNAVAENVRKEIVRVPNEPDTQNPVPDISDENTEKIKTILKDLFFQLATTLKMQIKNIDEQVLALRRQIGAMTIEGVSTSDEHYRNMHEVWATEGEKCKKDKSIAMTAIERLNMFREDFDNYDTSDLKNDWEFFKNILQLDWKEVRLFAGLNKEPVNRVKRLFGEVVLSDIPNEEQRLCYKLLEKLLSWMRSEIIKLREDIQMLSADIKKLEDEVNLLDSQICDYENNELDEYEKLAMRKSFREQQTTSRIKKSSKIPRLSDEEMEKIEEEIRQLEKEIYELKDGGYLENRKKELQDKEKTLGEKGFLKNREEKIRNDEAKFPGCEAKFKDYEDKKRKIAETRDEIQSRMTKRYSVLEKISVWVMVAEKFEGFMRDIAQDFLDTDDIQIILEYVETIIQKDHIHGLDVPRIRRVTEKVRELLSKRE